MSKVVVAADQNGNVIGISQNNPEYGFIRVEQNAIQINDEGWLRRAKRSALIKGKVEDLKYCDYKPGQELSGKIIVVESLIPFNPNNPDKDLKIAGETGVVCRLDDEPIYRQTFYTTNENASDEFIMHSNANEIKEVQLAQRAMSSLNVDDVKEPSL